MAIVSKTNRDGVDIVIEQLQQKFYPSLLGYWDGSATYQMYPRANKNYRNDDIIPEVSLDQKDYTEVLNSDKFSVTSFFLNNDERIFSDVDKRIKQSISIIFQADLVALYGESERMDEQFNMDILRVLKKENFYIYGDVTFTEGVDNVYRDLSISGELKESVKLTDLSHFHVLKVDFDVIYKPNCNATLPPVCAGVSISVDGVFSEVKPAGSSYNCVTGGSASIDISLNGNLVFEDQTTNLDIDIIDSTSSPTGNWNGTAFEIDNSTININTVEMISTPPASIVDLLVKKSDGTTNTGSKVGPNWIIGDVTQTVNTVAIAPNRSETSKAITIRYANNDPVVVTTITDNETVFIGEVPDVVIPKNTSNLYKTGQTVAYDANDDGTLERGNGSSFTVLSHNNYYGNTNRFTDDTGAQTYASGWVIDWSTWNQLTGEVLWWYNVLQTTGQTWANLMALQPFNLGGHTDCYIPNESEMQSVLTRGQSNALNYSPFNISVTTSAGRLWTTTTVAGTTANAYAFTGTTNSDVIASVTKVTVLRYIVMRVGNTSEL